MNTYVVLLRGINVGGKNSVSMAKLTQILEAEGYADVTTYIASGNILLNTTLAAAQIETRIEALLTQHFVLDSSRIKCLVLSKDDFHHVITQKPKGFGDHPKRYHSDVIFLMHVDVQEAFAAFSPKDGVDAIWMGVGVIYSQRLSSARTKSRLSKVMGSALYKSMTIRSWQTCLRLDELLRAMEGKE